VRILHLSDLHINSQFENEIDKEEQRYLHRSFFNTVQSINKRASFDAVVICGDFSATNPDQDLDDASRFVTELNKNTINNYDRLAIVPGNHELHWDDFNSCKLSAKPYKPYLQFYHSVYSSRISIVAEMSCWDRKNYLFDPGSQSNGLCWYRAIPSSNLSFFGLATPSLDPACQGEGVFTPEQQDQISHLPELKKNEIRICLMHHNINSMLSLSKKTETCILRNAGSAMHCLLSSGFQLALSGHTHSFNFNRLINSRLTVNGFSRPKAIDLVSGGSFGGKSSSNDKPNSFNIIEFSHANAQSGLRTLSVSPVLYDSDERKWFERPPIDIKPFEI
jgi:predicted phosphodiesterase